MIRGEHVLIAKDGTLVALDIQDCLADLGATSLIAISVADAIALIRAERFTFCILGAKLQEMSVLPIIEVLRARGVPFMFYTGVLGDELPRSVVHVPNPSACDDIISGMETALRQSLT